MLFVVASKCNAELPSLPQLTRGYVWVCYPVLLLDISEERQNALHYVDLAKTMRKLHLSFKPEGEKRISTIIHEYDEYLCDVTTYFDGILPICYAKIEVQRPTKTEKRTNLLISLFISGKEEDAKAPQKPQ